MATPFSIHQDAWNHCWVAATTAARVKKMQIDLNIQQRVARLLVEYGPESSMPLTLRVYGTMLKGFCVINNDRLRVLCLDCERLVLAFEQQLAGEDGKAARPLPTKRKSAEALSLDLDISKLQEAEAFDWTQATLEEGSLLSLPPPPEPTGLEGLEQPPPLLMQVDLLDESFPAVDMPTIERPCLAAPAAEESGAPAPPSPGNADDMLAIADLTEPALMPPPADGPQDAQEVAPAPAVLPFTVAISRGLKRPFKELDPGRVFGFDEETMLTADAYDSWMRDTSGISHERRDAAFLGLRVERPEVERAGILHFLFSGSAAIEVQRNAIDGVLPLGLGQAPGLDVVVPALVGGQVLGFGASAGAQQGQQAAPMLVDAQGGQPGAERAAGAPAPENRLACTQGADVEIVGALCAQPDLEGEARKGGGDSAAPLYDEQTGEVAKVIFRYVAASSGQPRGLTFEDLLPPSVTDAATAARTFLAVLTIATAGELHVEQSEPYAPISISAKQGKS